MKILIIEHVTGRADNPPIAMANNHEDAVVIAKALARERLGRADDPSIMAYSRQKRSYGYNVCYFSCRNSQAWKDLSAVLADAAKARKTWLAGEAISRKRSAIIRAMPPGRFDALRVNEAFRQVFFGTDYKFVDLKKAEALAVELGLPFTDPKVEVPA